MLTIRKQIAAAGFLMALAGGVLQAQSITVGPTGYITTGLGGTVQFTATITGWTSMTPPTVIWLAGGVLGGNATYGTIDSNGLYTAPAVMNPNAIPIMGAISGTRIKASQYVAVLAAGPVLTSVSPSPLPSGSATVTLNGTGFDPAGVSVMSGGVQWSVVSLSSTKIVVASWVPAGTTSVTFTVRNGSSVPSNPLTVPVTGPANTPPPPPPPPTTVVPVTAPKLVTLALGGTQQFSATGTPVPTWSAVAGTITAAGFYTAPAVMPASGSDTVTATNTAGTSSATVTLVSNVPPTISSLGASPLPLGVFSTTINGTGFIVGSTAQINGVNVNTTYGSPTQLAITGFAGGASPSVNVTVSNGPVISLPFATAVGVQNALASPAAARRFLEQAAFGPTPTDAAHVQTIGMQAWIQEQLAMPTVTNYSAIGNRTQGGLASAFLTNAVTNPDQLRQKVAWALSQIFVTSITKLIWTPDMIPYQQMLLADAFSNYRQILGDVTLSSAMGEYLDMANNAQANPAAGTAANENYAREIMQLFSIGTKMLNQDGTVQTNANGPIPSYGQSDVTETARVFTGWTYAPPPGRNPAWPSNIMNFGPMVAYPSMHDIGTKTLVGGYLDQGGKSPQQDLADALDNLAIHPNTAPFISKQLIQHLVKSNPSPAYLQRVVTAWLNSKGDMPAVLTAILMDPEARANDEGGNDQPADGHLTEPVLQLTGFVRAFGGQMTLANYFPNELAIRNQDVFNPPSVFNYYGPGFVVGGTGGLLGPEFQLDNPNAAVLRENLVAEIFNSFSSAVQTYGAGTTIDLTAFIPLAATPATLVNAIDLTLTHGVMPAAMKAIIVNAVATEAPSGALRQVETAVYLTLTSNYYNVWH